MLTDVLSRVREDWHFLTNLRAALKRLLGSKRNCLKVVAEKAIDESQECKQEQITDTSHTESTERAADELNQEEQIDTTENLTRAEEAGKICQTPGTL